MTKHLAVPNGNSNSRRHSGLTRRRDPTANLPCATRDERSRRICESLLALRGSRRADQQSRCLANIGSAEDREFADFFSLVLTTMGESLRPAVLLGAALP